MKTLASRVQRLRATYAGDKHIETVIGKTVYYWCSTGSGEVKWLDLASHGVGRAANQLCCPAEVRCRVLGRNKRQGSTNGGTVKVKVEGKNQKKREDE